MIRKVQINTQLLTMAEEEEMYWLKRSHEKWLHEGDKNTEFFHRVANGRRRKNTILHFEGDEGLIEGDDNLLDHVPNTTKNFLGKPLGMPSHLTLRCGGS